MAGRKASGHELCFESLAYSVWSMVAEAFSCDAARRVDDYRDNNLQET
jgi:hypothetical protein